MEIGYDSFSEPTGFHLARGRDELDGEDCDANVQGKKNTVVHGSDLVDIS